MNERNLSCFRAIGQGSHEGREAHSLFKNLFPAVIPVLGAKDVTEGEGLSR